MRTVGDRRQGALATRLRTDRVGWAALTVAQQLVVGLASAVFLVASSRSMTLDGRGSLALATSATTIAGTVAPLGVTHALLYFGGHGHRPGHVVRAVARPVTVATLVLAAGASLLLATLTEASWLLVLACGMGVAAYAASQITHAALYALAEVRHATTRRAAGSALLVVASVGMALGAADRTEAWFMAWILTGLVATTWQSRRLLDLERTRAWPTPGPTTTDVVTFCWRAAPLNMSLILAGRVDLWIVGASLDVGQVAVYSAALGVIELSLVFGQGIASSLQVRSASLAARSPRILFLTISLGQIVVTLAASAVVLRFAGAVFGPGYDQLRDPLFVLSLATGPMAYHRLASAWIAGMGNPGQATGASIVMAIGVAAAASVLTPILGLSGAALGSLLGYALGATYLAVDPAAPRRVDPTGSTTA